MESDRNWRKEKRSWVDLVIRRKSVSCNKALDAQRHILTASQSRTYVSRLRHRWFAALISDIASDYRSTILHSIRLREQAIHKVRSNAWLSVSTR